MYSQSTNFFSSLPLPSRLALVTLSLCVCRFPLFDLVWYRFGFSWCTLWIFSQLIRIIGQRKESKIVDRYFSICSITATVTHTPACVCVHLFDEAAISAFWTLHAHSAHHAMHGILCPQSMQCMQYSRIRNIGRHINWPEMSEHKNAILR